MRRLALALLPSLLFADENARSPEDSTEARGKQGMVVSVCPHASAVGLEILKQGGNAVDAAIAVEFALAVTWPEAGNIGGGGFMMIHLPGGAEVYCVDYRETAPGASTETMFAPEDGSHTRKMVGVPGTVRGMALAHEKFGSLEWKELVMPAVMLAKDGFEIGKPLADGLNGAVGSKVTKENPDLGELIRVYGKPGEEEAKWEPGDILKLPDLADTLERIANEGADEFYTGKTADLLVKEMDRGHGLISKKDLETYEAKLRYPIRGKFRGYDIYGAPPPSSGGVCVVQMLNVLEHLNVIEYDRYSPKALHLMAEAMKRAFCDRARFLADQDFVDFPPRLTRKHYARKLAEDIDMRFATPSETLAPHIEVQDESPSTTHFSVIDKDGRAVSNTTTLEASWGSRIVVQGAGFLLNNEMGDFNRFPDHTDRTGYIGTIPNRIEPGKRMLSSQSPTIVAYKGHPVLVTGSPGGRTIINSSLQMVLNVVGYEMPLDEAMAAPRMHHQWLPDRILFEIGGGQITEETVKALEEKGHKLTPRSAGSYQGDAHSISVDLETGEYHGVSDWRRAGSALGY